MKKIILIGSIATVLFANISKAQTVVSANCHTVTLTPVKVAYLRSFNNPYVNQQLDSCRSIKYNSTADVIIMMLSLPRAPKDNKFLVAGSKNAPKH